MFVAYLSIHLSCPIVGILHTLKSVITICYYSYIHTFLSGTSAFCYAHKINLLRVHALVFEYVVHLRMPKRVPFWNSQEH